MLFRKRTSAADFADRLIQLHATLFGRDTLLSDKLQITLKGQELATALSEWLFFGAYVIRQGVSARCRENGALRDAILDAFFDQMYAGLRRAGVKESDMPHVEDCIRARFRNYEGAQSTSHSDPAYGLGRVASTLIFGEGVAAIDFATVAGLHYADSVERVKRYFDDYRIASEKTLTRSELATCHRRSVILPCSTTSISAKVRCRRMLALLWLRIGEVVGC